MCAHVRALGVETRYVCWGTGIEDLDNDGNPDLFVVTGAVYPEAERKLPQFPYKTLRFLFRGLGGGRFEEWIEEGGPGVAAPHASRGAAFGDFHNDGDLDILIMNQNEPPSLLRNDVAGDNHWLKVKLTNRQHLEPERDRGARDGQVRRKTAGAGGTGAVELPFGERPPAAFRPGPERGGRYRDPLAERREGDHLGDRKSTRL